MPVYNARNILEKKASSVAPLSKGVKRLAAALGVSTPFGMDWVMQGHAPFTTENEDGSIKFDPLGYVKGFDPLRSANMVANSAAGALVPILYKTKGIGPAISTALSIPTKDLILTGIPTLHNASKALELWNEKTKHDLENGYSSVINITNPDNKGLVDAIKSYKGLIGTIGAGALGLGAAGLLYKMLKKDKEQLPDKGRIKYVIPGKKGDPTTYAEVDVPLDSESLSQTMQENISTNIRRQALKNIRANQRRRDPETGKLVPLYDYEKKYNVDVDGDGEIGDMGKSASMSRYAINNYMYS